MKKFDDLFRLESKVSALEYLVKFMLHLHLGKTSDPIGNASGFAEHIRKKLESNRPENIDAATHEFVCQQLGGILDDLVGEMKRDRKS